MKVDQLKKLLADVPDSYDVVVSGSDHSYSKTGRSTKIVQAELHSNGHLSVYYDEANKSDPQNPIVEVFWIDDGNY